MSHGTVLHLFGWDKKFVLPMRLILMVFRLVWEDGYFIMRQIYER
jgi:hypothetical protein